MVARWKGKEIGELMPADMVGADHKELDRFEAGLTQEGRFIGVGFAKAGEFGDLAYEFRLVHVLRPPKISCGYR